MKELKLEPVGAFSPDCCAAEILFDTEGLERFRQVCVAATGKECQCHDHKTCWLMDAAMDMS